MGLKATGGFRGVHSRYPEATSLETTHGCVVLLDRALRVYVAYLLAPALLVGSIALVGLVLPETAALVVGTVLAVVAVFAGLVWYAFGR